MHVIFAHIGILPQVESFGKASHAYSFWEGVTVKGKEGFGKLVSESKYIQVRETCPCLSDLSV
jgi:hypothetical protein